MAKKYKVLRDCTWKDGYWDENRIVEFPDDWTPPEHFQLVDRHGDAIISAPVDNFQPDPATMSQLNSHNKRNIPKTGMNYTKPEKEDQKQEAI